MGDQTDRANDQPTDDAPASVPAETVVELLQETNLPETSKDRLKKAEYETEEKVQEAIAAEVEYVKELTGSGAVRGMGDDIPPEEGMSNQEYEKGIMGILSEYAPSTAAAYGRMRNDHA